MNDFDESNPSVHFYQYKWSFGAHIKADERWLPDYHEIGPADKDQVFVYIGIGTCAEACHNTMSTATEYVFSKIGTHRFLRKYKTKIMKTCCWSDIPVDMSKKGVFDMDGKFKLFSDLN